MSSSAKKIVLTIASVLLFFAAAEGVGRAVYFFSHRKVAWPPVDETSYSRFTLYGAYEYIPGSEIPLTSLGYPARFLGVDRYGFVHNGEDRKLQENDFVIVLLGGSTVEGRGASSNAATIAAFLERILNEKFPGKSFRVLNAGRTGYIAYQEFDLLYGKILQDFKPAMVLAVDGRNDAANLIQYADHGWKPNWQPYFDELTGQVNSLMAGGGPNPLGALAGWLAHRFILAEGIRRAFQRPAGVFYFPQEQKPTPEIQERALENYFQAHALAFAACVGKRIPYHVFIQPALLESKKTLSDRDRKLRKDWEGYYHKKIYWESLEEFYGGLRRKSAGIPYFHDLSGIFRNRPGQVYFDSCHYTDAGSQFIAEKIADVIESEIRSR